MLFTDHNAHSASPTQWNPAKLAFVGGALGTTTGLAWEVFQAFRCREAEPEDLTHVLVAIVAYGVVAALASAALAWIRYRRALTERP